MTYDEAVELIEEHQDYGGSLDKHGLAVAIAGASDAPATAPAALTDEWIDAIMEQAQVFASAWSLVGGRFDMGDALETAELEKANLRALLATNPSNIADALTDEQIDKLIRDFRTNTTDSVMMFNFARAVLAANQGARDA